MDYQIGPSKAVERVYKITKPKVTTLSEMMLLFYVQVENRAELNSGPHLSSFSFFFPPIKYSWNSYNAFLSTALRCTVVFDRCFCKNSLDFGSNAGGAIPK